MASGSWADRLVEVIADRGDAAAERYRYGSGCIVRGRTVLTAAHVVAGAKSVQVRDPDKTMYSATVASRFVGDADGPGPDLALVEIDDPGFAEDLSPIGFARVDRDGATDEPVKCRAVGYPWFAETPSPAAKRDTVDAIGVVPVLSKLATGMLSVQVSISPRPLPPEDKSLAESEWSGMSGAPVLAADRLLGVVTVHAPREGPSAITAVPLTALEFDPDHPGWGPGVTDPAAWWARLGVTGLGDLHRLPVPLPERPEPAYRETLREFGRALHQRMPQLLGREQDLAEIAAFATGPPGYRWLVGGAYTGKTALLYEAVTAGLPDEVDVVSYFLSRRASDADSSRFLAAVVPQLAYLCEVDPPVADRDQFYALWAKATDRAAEVSRPLLLVVDGLDEDIRPSGLPSVASLLPTLVDGRAHVLVASRPHPELPVDVPDGHPLTSESIRVDLQPFEGAKRLADRARQEIYSLTHGADADTAAEVLGVLTAAAGPLSEEDLALLSNDLAPPSAVQRRRVRRLVTEQAARSLEQVGSAAQPRYQFAHFSLLEYAQANQDLADPEYRTRIHRWAQWWHDRGWPTSPDAIEGTPQYLLDSYPATLDDDPNRLTALVSDPEWVVAAIPPAGVDRVLALLRSAAAADPAPPTVAAMLAAVLGQAYHLRPSMPVTQPGYVLRQLWMQAAQLGEDSLASDLLARLQSQPGPGLLPLWTTRRASRSLSGELGRHDGWVSALAVLSNRRVVSGGGDRRVLVWDPAAPGTDPVELGRHDSWVVAVAALSDGRVVSAGENHRLLVWDPTTPGSNPLELSHDTPVLVLLGLSDSRVVSGGLDGRVLVWDPAAPGSDPVELGYHKYRVPAVAMLSDGRVVSGEGNGWLSVWDPAAPESDPVDLGHHDGWETVTAVAVLSDGRVVSGGGNGWVLVWDPAAPGAPLELGRYEGLTRSVAVGAVAGLLDGRVVSGGDDGRVLVWDPAAPGSDPVQLGRHDGLTRSVAVAVLSDGRVVSGGEDGRLLVWDPTAPVTGKSGFDHGEVQTVAVLSDGRLVSGGEDGRVLVWDPTAPETDPVTLGRHNSRVSAVAVLLDGRVVSSGYDERVLVWDPTTPGADPVRLGGHDGAVTAVAVLPDGRVVSSGYDEAVLLWDPTTPGARPARLGYHRNVVTTVAVLLDGRVVSGSIDERVLVWDPTTPDAAPLSLGGHDGSVTAMAALPDGRVVTGGSDGRVVVRNQVEWWSNHVDLGPHGSKVTAVAALPDGRVVSGGEDRRVLVWDVMTQTEIAQLDCSVTALAAEPHGHGETALVVGHGGAGLSLWSVT